MANIDCIVLCAYVFPSLSPSELCCKIYVCPLMQDTRLMKSAGTTSISIALRSTVVASFGLILMFMTSPLLSALTLACLPLLLISFRVFSKLNMRYTAEQLTASAQAANVAEECFGSIRTVHWPVTRPLSCAACGSIMGTAANRLAVRVLTLRNVMVVQQLPSIFLA